MKTAEPLKPLRLFVALAVPDFIAADMERLIEPLKSGPGPALKWSGLNGLHVTLKFLGATPPQDHQAIETILKETAAQFSPIRLHLSGFGAFAEPSRARIFWAGIQSEKEDHALFRLATQLEGKFESLGFKREARPYRPHMTIAKAKPPVDLRKAIASLPGPSGGWMAREICLYESLSVRGRSEYLVLSRFPFQSEN